MRARSRPGSGGSEQRGSPTPPRGVACGNSRMPGSGLAVAGQQQSRAPQACTGVAAMPHRAAKHGRLATLPPRRPHHASSAPMQCRRLALQTVAAASRQQEAPAARGRRSLVVRLLAPSLSAREAPPAARTSTRTMDHGGAARAPRALCGRGGRSSHGIGMGHGLCKLVCLHTYCSCMRAWRPQVQCRRRPAAPPCSAFHTLKMV